MGTYKIPQDVEAEDKLIGPFTFRQFIFLLIAAGAAFTGWLLVRINIWLVSIPLPVFLIFGFLGVYHREDQPVEIYLMAALNFFLKPRKRTWDPEGHVENVRLITPPRQAQAQPKILATEDRGQLERLAHVMDTRGWSTKRPELNETINRNAINMGDRLVAPPDLAGNQEPLDVHSSDDLLDPVNFPEAKKYRDLAENTQREAKQKAIAGMMQATRKIQKDNLERTKLRAVKYRPYPQGAKQTNLDPSTGRLQNRKITAKANHQAPPLPGPYLRLANQPDLSVQSVAQQAKRLDDINGGMSPGQEIDLSNQRQQLA